LKNNNKGKEKTKEKRREVSREGKIRRREIWIVRTPVILTPDAIGVIYWDPFLQGKYFTANNEVGNLADFNPTF
jgi:hypothetical protein